MAQSVIISFRTLPEVREVFVKRAKAQGLSLSEYMLTICAEHVSPVKPIQYKSTKDSKSP